MQKKFNSCMHSIFFIIFYFIIYLQNEINDLIFLGHKNVKVLIPTIIAFHNSILEMFKNYYRIMSKMLSTFYRIFLNNFDYKQYKLNYKFKSFIKTFNDKI